MAPDMMQNVLSTHKGKITLGFDDGADSFTTWADLVYQRIQFLPQRDLADDKLVLCSNLTWELLSIQCDSR